MDLSRLRSADDMIRSVSLVTTTAEEVFGEVRALAATRGFPVVGLLADCPTLPPLTSLAAFREFRERYVREILTAHEMPLIIAAYEFASRGQARELIAADQAWSVRQATTSPSAHGWPGAEFGEASLRVGRRQLNRLRPLRDLRVVQRYLAAIDANEARGWHPLVFGVVLASYGLPLRQGLLHFAQQTIAGFFAGAPVSGQLSEAAQVELFAETDRQSVAAVGQVLSSATGSQSLFPTGNHSALFGAIIS